MNGNLKGLTGAAVSVVAVFVAGYPAVAQTPANQPTTISAVEVSATAVRVSYRDLDLDTDDGRSIIRGRINRASHYVCGLDMQPLSHQMDQLSCVSEARRDAFAQLSAARTQVYAQADRVLVLQLDR